MPERIGPGGQAVLRYLVTHEEIGPAMAGRLLHEQRGTPCGHGARGGPYNQAVPARNRVACCAYATQDGWLVLGRLERRGLVRKVARGRYVRSDDAPRGMADSTSPDQGRLL